MRFGVNLYDDALVWEVGIRDAYHLALVADEAVVHDEPRQVLGEHEAPKSGFGSRPGTISENAQPLPDRAEMGPSRGHKRTVE